MTRRMARTVYCRLRWSDTWHFHSLCQHYQRIVRMPIEFAIAHLTKPKSGELCDECRRRKSVSGKHIVARKPSARKGK